MDTFERAIAAITDLQQDGIIDDYAIGGAMAVAFWSEPTATFDLDVFVELKSSGPLVSLEPIYSWARQRDYKIQSEHIVIGGLPVQIIPTPDRLAEEAVAEAASLVYGDSQVRVIRPEYLIALFLEPTARTAKRLTRVAMLLELESLDRRLLTDILQRYNLSLPTPL